ncbi:putative glutamyl-tRNA amidotransferase subunit A [Naviculisporaceae sp. PSN 640]
MATTKASLDVLTADVKTLQNLLRSGQETTRSLVAAYLAQIGKHDDYLCAMIHITPRDYLYAEADQLDMERRSGNLRGLLHGIPIIIKDNISTQPSLGLATTAGSLALVGCRPRKNATIVDMLLAQGAIILGKANLDEFSGCGPSDGSKPAAWSPLGGQTRSAYVCGGPDPHDSRVGHNNPGGSSGGSAVAVSAGYAPWSIGTETDKSLVVPAGRAALYTIKPTIGLVPSDGIFPISSKNFDSAGPMTKTVHDLALLLDAITIREDGAASYMDSLGGAASWGDLGVAVLDPTLWKFPDDWLSPVPIPEAEEQILRDIRAAYSVIKSKAKKFVDNAPLISPNRYNLEDQNAMGTVMRADVIKDVEAFLSTLDCCDVRSVKDIVDFTREHASQQTPPYPVGLDFFVAALEDDISDEKYQRAHSHMRHVARDLGIDKILTENEVDVIIGPAESFMMSLAAGAGYPVACMPLSYLDYNGRPFGLAAIAKGGEDATLVKLLSAWEDTFPPRRPPSETALEMARGLWPRAGAAL